MRLVDIGNETFINMNLIVSVYKKGSQFYLNMNDANRSCYHISEEAYNTILSYGKAKVQ